MTTQGKHKVAIVGCGFFARNHIHAWKSLDRAELVAVCDSHPDRAQAAAKLAGGVPFYLNVDEMLTKASPDVVDIITSPPSHQPLAELCAAYKTSAIIQKPLAMHLENSVAIADMASAAGVTMMVHENFRFQKPIREIKRVIKSGEIGYLRYCSVGYRAAYSVFPRDSTLRSGDRLVLMDMGVHIFDVARFLMGEISDLSCRIARARGSGSGDDMANAVVSFVDGGIGLVEVSSGSLLPDSRNIDTLISIEGSLGSVVLGAGGVVSIRSGNDERRYAVETNCPPWGTPHWSVVQDSVVETCKHWLDAANGLVQLELSLEDNLKTLAAVEACYRSSAERGATMMPDAILEQARNRRVKEATWC